MPGHASEGHHDGMVCLSEWKTFFDWCTERGEGEKYLAKAEEAAAAMQERFNARVEAVFKKLDADQSGELSMEEMERTFGEETHDFWSNMDGETNTWLSQPASYLLPVNDPYRRQHACVCTPRSKDLSRQVLSRFSVEFQDRNSQP